jgi:polyisoprenoid-binding protein YceI
MKTRNLIGVFATALTVSLVLGLAPQEEKPAAKPAAAKGAKFSVDDVHSSLIFGIEHMGVSMFYGRFNDLGGHYTLDLNNPEASTFEITAATDSVDTGNGGRCRTSMAQSLGESKKTTFPSLYPCLMKLKAWRPSFYNCRKV